MLDKDEFGGISGRICHGVLIKGCGDCYKPDCPRSDTEKSLDKFSLCCYFLIKIKRLEGKNKKARKEIDL